MIYKALSLHGEFISEIFLGEKVEEYRTWSTKIRGDVILCATADRYFQGHAALLVEIYDCVKTDTVFAFKLRNIRAIKPFPVKGQQRFFEIDCEPEIFDRTNIELFNEIYDAANPTLEKPPKRR